jgi:nucleotide-binding universal stress UspA family protein
MENDVRRIDRILLAIQGANAGRVEMRAALLAPELGIEAFDVLALKRSGSGVRSSTAYSHVQVDGGRLQALVDGQPRPLGMLADAGDLDQLWMVQRGHPAEVIGGTADSIGADLTLMAGSGRPRLPLWARPSRDVDVVRLCRGAVLLVHGEPRAAYRNVVVATDFSRASLAAARTAALLAPSARFVFVHAFQQPEATMMRELELPTRVIRSYREQGWEAARRRLDEFVDLFLHEVPPGRREVHAGRPHGVIRDCARRHQADLVVLGRGACHPGARLSCAHVMQKLMDEGECDLLIGPDRHGDGSDRRLAA